MHRSSPNMRLEILLPSAPEAIWATAEVVYDRIDSLFHGNGVRFTAMTARHAGWLQEWLRDNGRTERFLTHPARRHAALRASA